MEINHYEDAGLVCPNCGNATWQAMEQSANCRRCASSFPIDDGVLRMCEANPNDEVSRFYNACGGPHFVGTSFEHNPLIHITTRAYIRFLSTMVPELVGPLLDFGCGDGRLALWAAENHRGLVVAMDNNLASLKRLVAEAHKRGLGNLIAVHADVTEPPLKTEFFDAVLCFEVLYYLVPSLGRVGAIGKPASLCKKSGKMLLSEFSRYGRALLDVDAMDLVNAQSLVDDGTRWEKFANIRIKSFQWSLAELRADIAEAGLEITSETGISPLAALFNYAWSFTTYPLRPPLDGRSQDLLERLSDETAGACDTARNIVMALTKTAH